MPEEGSIFFSLLVIHIVAGFAALLASIGAVTTQWLRTAHRWHVLAGQVFFWGMVVIFLTALPLSWMTESLFLFLVSIFSGYLAWSGYRYAKRRRGPVASYDRFVAVLMMVTGAAMILLGGIMIVSGDLDGITLLVFGALGLSLSWLDLDAFRKGEYTGKQRIASHLGMMLGATIAAVTAFVVTNFTFQPGFVLWIAPTAVIVPLIVYWTRRVQA